MMDNIQCPFCTLNKKLFRNCKNRYLKTCGQKECIVKLRKISNLEKYGHVCSLHGGSAKIKKEDTIRERYGDDIVNISQLDWVKNKKIKTCRNNFGVDHPMQSSIVRDKSIKTVMRKYGVDNISKVQFIIEQIKHKNFTKDPITGLSPYELGMLKRKQFNLKKYGTPYYFQTEEFKQKYKCIMLEKYGVDNYFKTKEFSDEFHKPLNEYDLKKRRDYYKKVYIYTKKTFCKHEKMICGTKKRSKTFHLDHLYSINQGFLNNIDPKIIGSLVNLQLLEGVLNKSKGDDCWLTINELLDLYNKLDKEDRY